MTPTRRTFLSSAVAAAGLEAIGERPELRPGRVSQSPPNGLDPWIEVDGEALRSNARAISSLTDGRPTMAVIKNNGYGLGTVEVAEALEAESSISGFAVVKVSAALELRHAGIRKPVLHMGASTMAEADAMVREGIRLALFDPADPGRILRLAEAAGRPIPAHVYVDTGMSRLGIPAHRTMTWLRELSAAPVTIEGTFTGFTEEDFDYDQLERFLELAVDARGAGIDLGRLHAASSHGLFLRPEAHLDMVRPGLALYGAYPSGVDTGAARLQPAFRLRARVARVEHLREGDTVSYGRAWRAERATWTATLPVGHADGYPRRAVDGCEVLIGGSLYPVIGAVSASHTIVALGDEPSAAVGDVATLVGPDDSAIHPNEVAQRTKSSVYDVLMHLGQDLPRIVVS